MIYKGNGHFVLDWLHSSKLIVLNRDIISKIAQGLAEKYPECYIYVKNDLNPKGEYGKTSVIPWHSERINWTVDACGNDMCVYLRNSKGFFRYATAKYNEKGTKLGGYHGIMAINNAVNRLCGQKLTGVIGYIHGGDHPEEMQIYKEMQLRPMIWVDPEYTYRRIIHFYKADISSAYPSQADRLPDYRTRLELKGYYELSEFPDYDFAFYKKSKNIVERDVFDTREIIKSKWYNYETNITEIEPDEEITILMKYAAVNLSDIWAQFYKNRKFDDTSKATMLSAIGFLQSTKYNKNNFMGHASAVIYGRHISRMINILNRIEAEGNKPIMIATDSVAWIGGPSRTTTTEKALGAFVIECANGMACIKASGVYAYSENGIIKAVRHQGNGKILQTENMRSVMDILNVNTYISRQETTVINGIRIPMYIHEKIEI